MKISQTPAGTSSRIACTRPSQPLKSPITLTRSALGAQTAKCTPVVEPIRDAVRAELLEDPKVPALAEQVEIEIAEDTSVPIRIVDLDHVIAGKREPKAVIEGARIGGHARLRGLDHRLEETGRPAPGHRHQLARRDQPELDRARGGMERPHDDAAAASSGWGPSTANGSRFTPFARATSAAETGASVNCHLGGTR